MAITLPNLDDRRWSDLVEQGRALIPLYAPEWTDHNASDPGITLLELFAWVAEMDIYRVNRLTDAQKLKMLALMGVQPSPPSPATMACALRITAGDGPVALPAGSQFTGALADGTPVLLRSTEAIDVGSARLCAVQLQDTGASVNLTPAWQRGESLALFGPDPAPGVQCYLGFDAALPAGAWTRLFFGIAGEHASAAERARIVEGDPAAPLQHHGARLVWEYLAGPAAPVWRVLETWDDTRAFTLAGCVGLRPADAMQPGTLGSVAQACYWVRCRFEQGAYDAAPETACILVNGVELVQAAPVATSWPIARGTVTDASLVPGQHVALRIAIAQGQVVGLAIDTDPTAPAVLVLAYRAATPATPGLLAIEGALAGVGSGAPDQAFLLDQRPVVEAGLRLFSVEGARLVGWEEVDDFAGSTCTDGHFCLDAGAGRITLGNGERGRVLPSGSPLFACYDSMEVAPALASVGALADTPRNRAFSGVVIGRVGAGAPFPLAAAAAAETLAHAIGRAVQAREARLRAVTLADYEAIALATPGLRVARAIALPNLYPGLDCVRAPGMVTLIVLPGLPLGRPLPGAGFIERIAARIAARRMIGTRVVVSGPRYLTVAVRATIKANAGTDAKRLAQRVAQALDAFFDPLAGGPDGGGWPLGRDVYRAEVMQVIDQAAGVDHVLDLALVAGDGAPSCGNVCLRPTWLVDAGAHTIEVA